MANEEGLAGEFYTITAPSRFHAVHSKGALFHSGMAAPAGHPALLMRCMGESPRRYFPCWYPCFGFRVVEPHHDGTPHWHMLLLCVPVMWIPCAIFFAITPELPTPKNCKRQTR